MQYPLHDVNVFLIILLLFVGLIFLLQGSNLVLKGASFIARIFHISEYAIGITVVALSTSLPELFVSIIAAQQKVDIITIGNVVGSNTFNVALIFMLLSLVSKDVFRFSLKNLLFLFSLNFVVLGISLLDINLITRWMGILSLGILVGYFYLELSNKGKKKREIEEQVPLPQGHAQHGTFRILLIIAKLLLGGILLYAGSEIFLGSAREIGSRLHLSNKILSIVFIALGTSLPELIVTITAIVHMYWHRGKGENNYQDLAEGNIVGSNIFNILGVLGLSSTLYPLQGIGDMLLDIVAMTVVCVPLLLLLRQSKKRQRITGGILAGMLVVYLIILL